MGPVGYASFSCTDFQLFSIYDFYFIVYTIYGGIFVFFIVAVSCYCLYLLLWPKITAFRKFIMYVTCCEQICKLCDIFRNKRNERVNVDQTAYVQVISPNPVINDTVQPAQVGTHSLYELWKSCDSNYFKVI